MARRNLNQPAKKEVLLYAVGDVCVDRAKPDSIFTLSRPVISKADIAFCQLEIMYSLRGAPTVGVGRPLRAHPRNAPSIRKAGFNVVSCAGNHAMDWGGDALVDTIDVLKKNDMHPFGAGKDIREARKPVIVERKGSRVGFLAYNSILRQGFWATDSKPGCAPLRASTIYEPMEDGQPGSPCRALTYTKKDDLEAMKKDISDLKKKADIIVVSLHQGLHMTPAALAMYQKESSYAAIDAGADLIIGTHAHILKGIEVYKGKVITYSLCNFAFDNLISKEDFDTPTRKELAKIYPNHVYQADYPTYQFPVDSRKTIIIKALISGKGIQKVSYLPTFVNPDGQPEILQRRDKRWREVVNYMKWLCADLGTTLTEDGDEVVIS